MYTPKPIDTTTISLPKELEPLREQIAAHVHDIWAETKIRDGWTYADETDKIRKTHSDLIPYQELTEQMRQYDRNTAEATLKLLLALGWQIIPPCSGPVYDIEIAGSDEESRIAHLGRKGYSVVAAYADEMGGSLVLQRRRHG